MKIKSNISGFSIIEVMIAIFIFSMWMASVFMVISSSINLNNLNKNQIVAANLAREEIEIIRNIRDSNYKTFHKWNWVPNSWNDYTQFFEIWKNYKIENDFTSKDFPFKIIEIVSLEEWKSNIWNGSMDDFRLYINAENQYTYTQIWNKKTIFYRYLKIEKLKNWDWNIIPNTMKIKSKVIWYSKWYHEFEIKTILADFNRL